MSEKQCARCREVKPASAFTKARNKPGGLYDYCRVCRKLIRREHYTKDLEASRLLNRIKSWSRRYNLTPEQYDTMFKAQNGKCAICKRTGEETNGRGKQLQVDHDHITGKLRALLCNRCNLALGKFEDVKLLRAAIRYLKSPLTVALE